MANDTSSLKRKRSGGWIEVEEPTTPAPAIEPVVAATPEATKKLSLSWGGLMALSDVIGGAWRWVAFERHQIDLTEKERINLLEAALGEDFPLSIANVKLLIAKLDEKNDEGWRLGGSFPAVDRVAQEWVASQGVQIEPPKLSEVGKRLMDAMNPSSIREFLSSIGAVK